MMRHTILLFLLCAFGATPLFASVYKCKDAQGEIIYTDTPCDGKKLDLPSLKAYTPVDTRSASIPSSGSTNDTGEPGYEVVEIVSPDQDATIRDAKGNVDVRVLIKPRLFIAKGDKIAIVLDGKQLDKTGVQTLFRLQNLARGSHSVQVFILDQAGKVIRASNTVTFHVRITSVFDGGFQSSSPENSPSGANPRAAPRVPRPPRPLN